MNFYSTLLTLIISTLIPGIACTPEDDFSQIFNQDYLETLKKTAKRFSDLSEETKIYAYQNLPLPSQKTAILSLHQKLQDTLPQLITYRKRKNACKRATLVRSYSSRNLASRLQKIQSNITNLTLSLSIHNSQPQELDTILAYSLWWFEAVKNGFIQKKINLWFLEGHWGILRILIRVQGLDIGGFLGCDNVDFVWARLVYHRG